MMIPMTPYCKEVNSVNVDDDSMTSMAASDSDFVHAKSEVHPIHQQVEGKKEDNGEIKIKEDLKTKKPVEKKQRRQWPKIILNPIFECTPKPKTPKTKTPKQAKPTKTPKQAKQKKDVLKVKRKYTKRSKSDKKALVIVEEDVTTVDQHLPAEIVTVEHLPVVKIVVDEHLPIEMVVVNEKPPIIETYCRRNKVKESAKRVLDFDLNCQLDEEGEVKESIVENSVPNTETVNDSVPQESSNESSSSILLTRGCRGSLQLRCQCCVCRIEKVKPAFPKESKRIRTSNRIVKAKRRRLLPSKMSKEDIMDCLKCPLALASICSYNTKRRMRRINKFSKEMPNKATIWKSVVTDQQVTVNECREAPRCEGISHSPLEVNPSFTECIEPPRNEVISNSPYLVDPSLSTNGFLDHSRIDGQKKVTKGEKKQSKSIKKEAKVTKERKAKKDVVKVSKGKKKKNKEEKDLWEKATTEERVEIIAKKIEELTLNIDLAELHASTQMEVQSDEEEPIRVWNLLKDRAEDGSVPSKEEEEEEARKKWWDEQSKVLLEKAGLFVMVMREILGDRKFSPWKGSVVDSIVGVFLTQNVSDSLSSSAYMSLAARFPLRESRENVQLGIEYNPASSHERQEDVVPDNQSSQGSTTPHLEDIVLENSSSQDSCVHHLEDVAGSQCSTVISSSQHIDVVDKNGNSNMIPSSNVKKNKKGKDSGDVKTNWDDLRTTYAGRNNEKPRHPDTADSVDWDAVRKADVGEIAKAIEKRGQHNIIAQKIKDFLNRVVEDHGSIDLEWLRVVPPEKAKEYLLDIYGIGLKSVECLRLLTLHHHAFPVDVNVGRIAVRLGWIPLKPLPDFVHLHMLNSYPYMDKIQDYLWPRLSRLDQRTLYELHYLLITFGKVFCTAKRPHCNACPLRGQCKYYASASASSRLALSGSQKKGGKKSSNKIRNPFVDLNPTSLALSSSPVGLSQAQNYEPIIEEPASPEPERLPLLETDIEDLFSEDSDEISSIDLTSQRFIESEVSRAIVTLSSQASSRAPPVQKLVAKLKTLHQVYELPDSHPLLHGLAKREQEDPSPYLLAIWPQDETCQEQDHQTVPGTFLIPCRTAMKGRFPLNGTYFQMNEVFADDETSKCPINVPRNLIWNLPKRTLYCGTSTSSIVRGLGMEQIKDCFWKGFICIRAFNRRTKYPRKLSSKFYERATTTPSKKTDNVKRPIPIPRNQREVNPETTIQDDKN